MKLGLIGLKGHQGVVMRGAKELGDVELVAVSAEKEQQAQKFIQQQKLGEGDAYENWKHLVEHAMLDVCCVCGENGERAEQLIALAERNIHIVTEKPLATTLEDLARVKQALAKSKSRLTMLLTMRHDPKYVMMRKLVQDGAIGEVNLATAQKSYRLGNRPEWQKSRKRLGGTIPYIGIHALDLMRWISGLDYTHVAAFHGNIGMPQMEETESHASVLARFAGGGSATARLDYLRPMTAPSHGDDRVRLAGNKGVIEIAYPDKEITLITTDKPPHRISPEPTSNLFTDFVQAIRDDRAQRISADDAFSITEVVLKARQAADKLQVMGITPDAS